MAKPILQVIKEVCPVIGLTVPTSFFTQTDREWVELQNLANEMATRIAEDTHDWSKLKQAKTFLGNGVYTSFALPTDYARMLKTTRLYHSAMPVDPLIHVTDTDEWLAMQVQNFQFAPSPGYWTRIGDDIHVRPIIASGANVQFYYLSNLIVSSATNVLKTEFEADTDTFRLDARLLRLGIIWQWKANKGFPYAEDMANYETALAMLIGSDKGSNIIKIGGRSNRLDLRTAYPWQLG